MGFVGMTPDQIDAAASQLNAQVQELQSIKTQVNSLVEEASVHWNGADMGRFRNLWYTSYQTMIAAAADRLAAMATALGQQANQQRVTSSDTATGAASAFIPIPPDGSASDAQCAVPPAPDPDLVAKLEDKLRDAAKKDGLSDEEIARIATDIATMVAAADEPYKSLFYEHIDGIDIVGMTEEEVAKEAANYYSDGNNNLHLSFDEMWQDTPPYHTFFHEFGHAIDDQEDLFGYESRGYTYDGRTVFDSIQQDVKNSIAATAGSLFPNLSEAECNEIAQAYVNRDKDYLDARPDITAAVQQYYARSDLNGDSARTAGDIFNGTTGGMIPAKWTHSNKEKYPDYNFNGLQDDYWYSFLNTRMKKQESEMWAGFYADNMINHSQVCPPGVDTPKTNEINLTTTESFFPSTTEALEAMAQEMKDN